MATHSTELPFGCDLCDKAFSRKSNLQRHAEIHAREQKKLTSDEVGQECPVCFKNVTGDFKRHVKYHEKTEQNTKIYSCDLCSASYTRFNNLQAHMWRHTVICPLRPSFPTQLFTVVLVIYILGKEGVHL